MKQGRTKRMMGALAFAGAIVVACSSGDGSETIARSEQEAVLGPCTKHADCEDGNPCTQNLCALGACAVPLPVLGCCFNGNCNTAGTGGSGGSSGGGAGGKAGAGGTLGTGGVLPIGGLGGALPVGGLGGALPIGGLGGALPIGGTTGTGGSLPIGCSLDAECDDGNPCTQNLCLIGSCLPLPVVGCCYQGVCEGDGSAGEGGGPPIVTGGCSKNEQCDDNNECTQDLCVLGLCTTLPVLTCDGSAGAPPVLGCSTNEECEDGNDCIQNLCLLGLCTSLPVIGGVCGGEGGTNSGGTSSGGSAGSGNGGSSAGTANGGSSTGEATGGTTNGGTSSGGTGAQAGASSNAGKAGTDNSGGEDNGGSNSGGTNSGATNTGASSSSAGEAGQSNDRDPVTDWGMQGGGCGCKVAAAPRHGSLLSGLLAAVGLVAIRARRRKRAH